MSKLSHAPKEAINMEDYHAIEEQIPELFEAIKQVAPTLNSSVKHEFDLKVASLLRTLVAEKEVIDLKEYHRQANEELFPELAEAIMKLRPVLSHFRDNKFAGVPKARKLTVHDFMRTRWTSDERHYSFFSNIKLIGRWVEKAGFLAGENIQVLALNGLLIICPESFPDDRESKAVIESEILFGKIAV